MKGVGIQASHVLFDVGNVAKIEESKHKGIKNSEHMRGSPLANLASVFSEGTITAIMQAIFDGPVLTVQFQQKARISLVGCEAGNPIDDLLRTFERMFNASA